ncbi:secondary thiamine-phosphate synthase enzyme [Evansella caseinilytica]|uniref:Secondary thiamine-phosphate synthase enzyme n=1 Tax=Evansella caseinilytica TaxID=1503961 RepID=A0A1H3RWB6_9BACI|nr:secondary thiamine-phosphate synthase enzyme YjbQ [Evansella caseinilytica]SDZ29551.1 secondary thiamine-phosphate synthase enzyme [Evansella caseinilytica]
MFKKVSVRTTQRDEMMDITGEVRRFVNETGVADGVVYIYCPHTTAGITINENADPDVKHDMLMRWDEIYPWTHDKYRHAEGNSASHLKASTVGATQVVLIHGEKLALGTWQGIYFCEFDGPRPRSYYLKIIAG